MAYTILIVDSRREFMRSLQKALESLRESLIITSVMSGEEALLETRINPVSLLITDNVLPGMPAEELIKAVRGIRPGVKTILFNGADGPGNPNLQPEGVNVVLSKPVQIDAFLASVTEILALDAPGPSQIAAPEPGETAPVAEATENADTKISARLARLRQALKADAVMLVNDTGQVMIQAGGMEDERFESAVLPTLMTSFNAGVKVSQLLGQTRQHNTFFYRGEKYDLVMSSISNTYALVISTRDLDSSPDSSSLSEKLSTAQLEITAVLEQMGIPLTSENRGFVPPFFDEPEEPLEVAAEELDDRLESLIDQALSSTLRNANDFWDPEGELPVSGTIASGSLSYEQALRLGLAPLDEEEN